MNNPAAIRTPVLFAALAAIALLAVVLPFSAINALHARRLDAADADLRVMAERMRSLDRLHTGAAVLAGPGDTPRSGDPRWTTGTSAPLNAADRAISPDPWGNAYVVNAGVPADAAVWVLSAGPDGVIDTPFIQPDALAATQGDDRALRVR